MTEADSASEMSCIKMHCSRGQCLQCLASVSLQTLLSAKVNYNSETTPSCSQSSTAECANAIQYAVCLNAQSVLYLKIKKIEFFKIPPS
jgi:hypothetical protein